MGLTAAVGVATGVVAVEVETSWASTQDGTTGVAPVEAGRASTLRGAAFESVSGADSRHRDGPSLFV